MLTSLSLRDLVLIDRLTLDFSPGLTVLTGETGAGKSILLDGLGLALGARADSTLLAPGATEASAAASFSPPPGHPVRDLLAAHGLVADAELLFRRVLAADGRTRAFINDEPVSVALLRQAGTSLVEIEGQHEQLGLAEPAVQRALLDSFAVDPHATTAVAANWATWRAAQSAASAARDTAERASQDAEWLAHAAAELAALAPQPDEEARLALLRQSLQHYERQAEAVAAALAELAPRERRQGPQGSVRAASRALERLSNPKGTVEETAGKITEARAALTRAEGALADAEALLDELVEASAGDPGRLEQVETRLFALRAAARKHKVLVDDLPEVCERLTGELNAIEERAAVADRRTRQEKEARDDYLRAAARLTAARDNAAATLEAAVTAELPPLKLEKSRFQCRLAPLPEAGWGPQGADSVSFLFAANPGHEPLPLSRAASGGELARLMLALKVVLAGSRNPGTLIFDEVDAGIGGAAAAAVGERLARIAEKTQVLVVTHSPQVAVHGRSHISITKQAANGRTTTHASPLSPAGREEEIARMLAGASVTEAARAAAASLLAVPHPLPRRRRVR
ncbi:MAG: DNA repair protein RecN [Acetobacteraceae bacterium]